MIEQDAEDFLDTEQFEKDDEDFTLLAMKIAKERGVTLSKFKKAIDGYVVFNEDEWTDLFHDYLIDLTTMKSEYTDDIARWYLNEHKPRTKL